MKRLALLTLAVILSAGMAMAYGPGQGRGGKGYYGGGYNGNGCGGNGYNVPCGEGQNANSGNFEPVTEEAAKAAVEKYVSENFKGYKIEKFDKFVMPRGVAYQATAKDSSGNIFYFHVNRHGNVRGPILSK